MCDDAGLVVAVREGAVDAYTALVDRHRRPVFALCYRVAGQRDDAEELAHDAFVEGFLRLDQLAEPASFGPWIRRIALNLCRMRWRKQLRENGGAELPDDVPEAAPPRRGRLAPAVLCGLDRLGPAHRLVIVLHYLEGLSYAQVAESLDVPIGTVMSRLHRAREALRGEVEALTQVGDTEPADPGRFSAEVIGEITTLLSEPDRRPEGLSRLSIILANAPERMASVLSTAPDLGDVNAALAGAAFRLGAPVAATVVSATQADGALGKRARGLLDELCRAGSRPGKTRTWNTLPAMGFLGAYSVVGGVLDSALANDAKAELLLGALERTPDIDTANLLSEALLCVPEAARGLLASCCWVSGARVPMQVLVTYLRTGEPTVAAIVERLNGADASARARAASLADMLTRLAQHHAERGKSLGIADGELLASPPPRWLCDRKPEHLPRWAVVSSASRRALADALLPLVTADEAASRHAAIASLGRIGEPRDLPVLREALGHGETATQVAALHALADLGDEGSLDAAAALLGGDAPTARAVAQAFARLANAARLPALVELAGHADWQVAESALGGICRLAWSGVAEAVAALEGLASAPAQRVRCWAEAALRNLAACSDRPARTAAESAIPRVQRGGGNQPHYIAMDAALRALPELRTYADPELSDRVAEVCSDWANTRRALVGERLMDRSANEYRFTERGAGIWRVEHTIRERYMGGV